MFTQISLSPCTQYVIYLLASWTATVKVLKVLGEAQTKTLELAENT